jgi:hypothetical protein
LWFPIVTPPAFPSNYFRFGQILVAENADEFIKQTIRLYREESLWMEIQKKSLEFIRRNSRPELGRERLATIISRGLAVSPDPACRKAGSLGHP